MNEKPPTSWPKELRYIRRLEVSSSLDKSIARLLAPKGNFTKTQASYTRIKQIDQLDHPAHGQNGLFAARDLRPGDHIVDYMGLVHMPDASDSDAASDYDLSLRHDNIYVGIDANKMGNESRMINDYRGCQKSPNARFDTYVTPSGEVRMGVFVIGNASKAGKGIRKGEEILLSKRSPVMDPSLTALFAQSAGPVQKPAKKDRTLVEPIVASHNDSGDANQSDAVPPVVSNEAVRDKKKKQRKRKRDDVLLEDLYMSKLAEKPMKSAKTTEKATAERESIIKPLGEADSDAEQHEDSSVSDSDSESEQGETMALQSTPDGVNIQHETQQRQDKELEKANSTVFVGNLPTSVITSHADYKALKALFANHGKVQSIRFRSIAFSELLPRKVAFVQGKFHPERDTCNAYIVLSSPSVARAAIAALNGHFFLEKKHVRVDSVAHPAAHENKKCVFVGSLPFDAEEELLWSHFAAAGAIESVRVIRDKKTNVGKGFAYVQFQESSSVQNALLLHEKKMVLGEGKGTRKLRVTRASAMPSKHRADQRERDQLANPDLKPRDKAKLGRVKNLMGSQAAAKLKILQKEIAMEGERAKAPDGERTRRKKKKSKKDTARSKARAAAYRKADKTVEE